MAFGATEWGNLTVKGNLTANVGSTSLGSVNAGTTSVGTFTAGTATLGATSVTSLQTPTIGTTSFTGSVSMGSLSASTLPVLNSSKTWISSGVTQTVLEYIKNLTSDAQTQIDTLGVPVGTVIMFMGGSCPSGYLSLDGSAVSRTTYSALFALSGTTYGSGNGSTTFNLANAQGVFVRGAGTQSISGISYTGTQGTTQGDQFQGHYHTFTNGISYSAGAFSAGGGAAGNTLVQATTGPITDGSNGTPRTGSETRPANITLVYCVKT